MTPAGKTRTVQVEVRKKRVLVKRDPAELRAKPPLPEAGVVEPPKPEVVAPAPIRWHRWCRRRTPVVEAPPPVEVAAPSKHRWKHLLPPSRPRRQQNLRWVGDRRGGTSPAR